MEGCLTVKNWWGLLRGDEWCLNPSRISKRDSLFHHHFDVIRFFFFLKGKVERFHGTIKKECIRKKVLLDQDHAKIIIGSYIAFYNNQRLHSANTYITSADQLASKENKIHEGSRKKIHVARLKRKHNVLRDEIKLNKLEYKLTS